MAHIQPFRAWRYHPDLTPRLESLIAPPSDTLSAPQQRALYQQPYNCVHLSVPRPNQDVARVLHHWKSQGILRQDPDPAIYGYYQRFRLPGDDAVHCQKGFICFIKATYWAEEVVLRHEDTLPHSVDDRAEMLATTQLQTSPTHGLYSDPARRLEALTDVSMQSPLYDTEDAQGVRHTLSCLRDPKVIREFTEVMRRKPVILADGHHRYESSLRYRRQREASAVPGDLANYHMMYLTNTEGGTQILPTHRLVRGWPSLRVDDVMQRAKRYFLVEPLGGANEIPAAIKGKPRAFGVATVDQRFCLQLKPVAYEEFPRALPGVVRELDTTAIHYFFIDRLLGLPYDEQRKSPRLTYEPDFWQSVAQLERGTADLALVLQPVTMEQVKRVCYSGHLMPQKSTYFYPKTVGGLVFGSLRADEL